MNKTLRTLALMALAMLVAGTASAQLLRRGGQNGGPGLRAGGPRMGNRGAAAQQSAAEAKPVDEQLKEMAKGTNGVPLLHFREAPIELLLQSYAQEAGKVLIMAPNLPKTQITLDSGDDRELTRDQYLEAIEVTLTMNGVVLEPFDKIFLRAFERKSVRTQGIRTSMDVPATNAIPEKGRVISQLIRLQHISADEAQKALEGFKDPSGLFQVFERNNTVLVTDTQENVNRMLEIIRELDVANPVLEDVFTRQIQYALATDIKTALETIVTESQKDAQQATSGPKTSGGPGFASRQQPPAVQPPRLLNLGNRPGLNKPDTPAPVTPNATMLAEVSDADRGMIRGKVLILADERSNKLIVITSKANMDFFDKVIETLDVETTPEVSVEVLRLKYAEAEEVASMLNDLIGNGSSSSQSKNNQNQNTQRGGAANRNLTQNNRPGASGATPAQRPQTANPTFSQRASSSLGELNKDNIKILADKRINGIVVMARKADMKAVKEVIEDMDVKLSQVLIETVIVQVELGDDLTTGVDWLQRGKYRQKTQVQQKDSLGRKLFYAQDDDGNLLGTLVPEGYNGTDSNGNAIKASSTAAMRTVTKTIRDNLFNHGNANAGYMLGGGGGSGKGIANSLVGMASSSGSSSASGGDDDSLSDAAGTAAAVASGISPAGSGLSYYLKSDKLNLATVIQACKGDSRTKVLASPILMTVDNKEATIEATDMIYLFSGYQYSGSSYSGTQVRNYEKRDIGLTVKVTPRINPNGTVVLTVEQTFETQGADQNVPNESGGTDPYATVTTRKISSDVSVENHQTVVMGGLTKKTLAESETGIPILKDIPFIGKWLFGTTSTSEKRSELLVFMTPYVLDDADAAQAEAIRRKKALSDPRPWEDNGWSTSPVADPVSKKEQLRRLEEEWARQDEERKTAKAMEEARAKRAKRLAEMDEADRKEWAERHQKEIREEFERVEGEQKDLREVIDRIREKTEETTIEAVTPAAEPGSAPAPEATSGSILGDLGAAPAAKKE